MRLMAVVGVGRCSGGCRVDVECRVGECGVGVEVGGCCLVLPGDELCISVIVRWHRHRRHLPTHTHSHTHSHILTHTDTH